MKNAKKFAFIIIIMAMMFSLAMPISVNAQTKSSNKSITLNVGKTYTLKVTGTKQKVTWSSSNKKVATVSAKGKITAKKRGYCKITAKYGKKKLIYKVTVKQPVKSIVLKQNKAKLMIGEKLKLNATVSPLNANNKKVKWISSNNNIATVSQSGVVTAKTVGSVVIKVQAIDGSKKYASCTITVEKKENVSYKITNKYLDVRENDGKYFAYVEITNTGNVGLYMNKAIFEFNDNNGNLVESEDSSIYCTHEILAPGDKGYFYMGFGYDSINGNIDLSKGFNFNPVVKVVKATGTTTTYKTSDESVRTSNIGCVEVIGRITNHTDKDAGYVYLVSILYDANDKVLGISGTSITDLDANTTISFRNSFLGYGDYFTADDVAKVRTIVQKSYYQFN